MGIAGVALSMREIPIFPRDVGSDSFIITNNPTGHLDVNGGSMMLDVAFPPGRRAKHRLGRQ